MKYKLLGNTGLKVSALCLGTMNYGGKGYFSRMGNLGQEAVDEQFRHAIDAGINFIDTANIYSEGLSEELIGHAIKNLGLTRDDLMLATKVRGGMGKGPNDKGLSRKHILKQVEASLKRLQTDYIDLYQIHSIDPLTPVEETLRVLDDLVRSGKVRYIGASNMAAWLFMKALAYSTYHDTEKFVSLQAHYSIATREIERELIPLVKDQQVGLMVWSPLAGGLLTGKYKRDGQEEEKGRWTSSDFQPLNKDRVFNLLDKLQPMANEKGATLAQLSLAWLLHQPSVTTIITGANKISQLDDNLKSTEVKFTEDELQQLKEVSKLPLEYPGYVLEALSADRKS